MALLADTNERGDKVYRRLSEAPGALHESVLVTVGDQISVDKEAGFLRGHGTLLAPDGNLMAAVCGVVERVNKLVSVRPLRGRPHVKCGRSFKMRATIVDSLNDKYVAETGDVVVGRITEVANKRWKVNINSQQDAQLMLSAVNLPGGIQRRRTTVDELNMRSLFCEGDLISAEVQSSHKDGSVTIHTRSLKYGKLEGGQLVKVSPYLIKRLKQHFHILPNGAHLILGCNGYIWVGAQPPSSDSIGLTTMNHDQALEGGGNLNPATSIQHDAVSIEEPWSMTVGDRTMPTIGQSKSHDMEDTLTNVVVPLDLREQLCRVAMSTKALSALGFPIFPNSIMEVYKCSIEASTDIKDMLTQGFLLHLGEREASRREENGPIVAMES